MEEEMPSQSPVTPLTARSMNTPLTPARRASTQSHPLLALHRSIQTRRPTAPRASKITKLAHPRASSRWLKGQQRILARACSDTIKSVLETSISSVSGSPRSPRAEHTDEAFRQTVAHLRQPLQPLISLESGEEHPKFPRSILQYHLLTHETLDELCHFYHQTLPSKRDRDRRKAMFLASRYPAPLGKKAWVYSSPPSTTHDDQSRLITRPLNLATKRRRFGRFCGLQGCESPAEVMGSSARDDNANDGTARQQKAMDYLVDREWNDRMRRLREEEERDEKVGGRREW